MSDEASHGFALRIARRRSGMSLDRLAADIGVSVSYLSKIERESHVPSSWIMDSWERVIGLPWPGRPSVYAPAKSSPEAGQLDLGLARSESNSTWMEALLPSETLIDPGPPALYAWDLPQTISELSYLTHNFYRYYGKFPPSIPRKLLRDYPPREGTFVLDPYSGSGTTLVEAMCEGIPSIGVDISPLATLAGSVKTTLVGRDEIGSALRQVLDAAAVGPALIPDEPTKWFTPEVANALGRLKVGLLTLPTGAVRSFLALAFFAIIRRVSLAHDGEVRPHLNQEKRQREVGPAYTKKVGDMLDRMDLLRAETARTTARAIAVTGDSRSVSALDSVRQHPIGMVISHPPYLNCFDYVPVYKLEYYWAAGFDEVGPDFDYQRLRKSETRAWPATDERIFGKYFDDLDTTYRAAGELLEAGDKCAVVLGDCTIHGKVVPVLDRFTDLMAAGGFDLDRTFLRSTHYGIGKYAYAERADYHGSEAEKRDGVLLFTKR